MPSKKTTTTPPPAKVKAGKTKAAPPKVSKPVTIPHRPATAPAEKLVPRRGWKGPALPFNDIDSALAWGFGDMKVGDAEDEADAFEASDTHHRGRAKLAEDELRTLPKRDAAGVLRSRDLRRAERADNPDAPPIPANVVGGPRRRGRFHTLRAQSAEARGHQPAAPEPPAPAPKKEPPPAPAPAPKKEPPPAPAPAPKKEPPPAPAGPKKEPEAAAASRRAAEKAEEASLKEEQFREERQLVEDALVKYRRAKTRIPDELKEKQKLYSGEALRKLTNERIAAEKLVAEVRVANAGASRREAAKKKK
jgi:hypothetical protein